MIKVLFLTFFPNVFNPSHEYSITFRRIDHGSLPIEEISLTTRFRSNFSMCFAGSATDFISLTFYCCRFNDSGDKLDG